MMRSIRYFLQFLLFLFVVTAANANWSDNGIDPEALIERIIAVDKQQREMVQDVTYDAEYVERDDKGEDGVKEKVRILKKVYVKYLEDTTLFYEEYLEFYKEGELQSPKKTQDEAKEQREKNIKRKRRNISHPILNVFYPENRGLYDIEYKGVADQKMGDRICHLFQVAAKEKADSLINGDFYFEAEGFHLVRVDFSPAKLVKKIGFKLTKMKMSIAYEPNGDDLWLPRQFDIEGKGKVMIFFGINFAGTEYYRSPVVNSGLEASRFEVGDGSRQ